MSESGDTTLRLAVICEPRRHRVLREQARTLAAGLNLPFGGQTAGCDGLLVFTPERLELRWQAGLGADAAHGLRPIAVDFDAIDTSSPHGRSRKQPIARAVGLGGRRRPAGAPLRVLDATAGLGEDAWLLASLGCQVVAVERHGLLAALLTDGLRRARASQPEVARRLSIIHDESFELLRRLCERPQDADAVDVVYLDPMFPPRGKAALERGAMRVLRRLVGDDPDAAELLDLARQVAVRRVVVKRPLHAEPLAPHPTATHAGKSLRYDVYAV